MVYNMFWIDIHNFKSVSQNTSKIAAIYQALNGIDWGSTRMWYCTHEWPKKHVKGYFLTNRVRQANNAVRGQKSTTFMKKG